MAPRLTVWLSQDLEERIPIGVDGHFGMRHRALEEAITKKSADRAVDALQDSDAFLEMLPDSI